MQELETIKADQQDLDTLKSRVDNLTANPGKPTEGNAELIDIRVGADGRVYPTAGDALREVDKFRFQNDLLKEYPFEIPGFIDNRKGTIVTNDYHKSTNYIPAVDYIYLNGKIGWLSNPIYFNISCYDKSKRYLGGCWRLDPADLILDYLRVDLLEGTYYIRITSTAALTNNPNLQVYDLKESDYWRTIIDQNKKLEYLWNTYVWVNGEDLYIDTTSHSFRVYTKKKNTYILSILDDTNMTQLNLEDSVIDLRAEVNFDVNSSYWLLYLSRDSYGNLSILARVTSYQGIFRNSKYVNSSTWLICAGYGSQLIYTNPYSHLVLNGKFTNPTRLDLNFGLGMEKLALISGGFNLSYTNSSIQVTSRILSFYEKGFIWIDTNAEPLTTSTLISGSINTVILVYNKTTKSLDVASIEQVSSNRNNYIFIADLYQKNWYNSISNPSFKYIEDGITYTIGSKLYTETTDTFIEKKYKDYIADQLQDLPYNNPEKDGLSDIILPNSIDVMEGRQFSLYYDCLSRFENASNLYRIINSKSINRNELCLNYTPADGDTDFSMQVVRLDRYLATPQESKNISIKVNHKLGDKLTKNVCLCGDSLVDNGTLATEVYRMLTEDGDCIINQIGTRGPVGGKHEGRGSWSWKTYLEGNEYAGKTNAFWDAANQRLDFQKYCSDNGFSGIDYFLIALGTNDVSQGSNTYNTLESVKVFIDRAKQFLEVLLSEDRGYPNCKVGIGLPGIGADYFNLANTNSYIFRKSMNTLNLAYLTNFDAGKWHPNVTCFSHGIMTNRKYAFPYSEGAISDRYNETCRILTNNVHPTTRGYQAWADGYYNKIRGFLTDDSK